MTTVNKEKTKISVNTRLITLSAVFAAMTYALTIHSLIDYRMDQITAKEAAGFAEGNRKVPVQISRFIKWFSRQIGEHER